MIHTLKTLYLWLSKHYPDLTGSLPALREYCQREWYEPGTLRWLIYKLRRRVPQVELQRVFHNCCKEACLRKNEEALYGDIMILNSARKYRAVIERKEK